MNVRRASKKNISNNGAIKKIMKIMGLEMEKCYDTEESLEQLRYGHILIMADSDYDGSHFKGLVINLIDTLWPSLLKRPSFLRQFATPIMKVFFKGMDKKFYTIPEYKEWVEDTGAVVKKEDVKYYKGLASSGVDEAKKYFSDFKKHTKSFRCPDEKDKNMIDLVFSNSQGKTDARKKWLLKKENGSHYLDPAEETIKLSDFFEKEYKGFSRAAVNRSIPSLVDGLKPTQRKILFCGFKKNLVHEMTVVSFSSYVSENTSYHHGEVSIQKAITGMAQNFAGSNNVNLFKSDGLDSRYLIGKRPSQHRYISTKLADVTRYIFPEKDDVLLDNLEEFGEQIEPAWYMPIIPMVLVNGVDCIASAWSSKIPNYNPRDLIANIKRFLRGDPLEQMDPWYNNFKGTIQQEVSEKSGVTIYKVSGKIDVVHRDDKGVTLLISELPLQKGRKGTQAYENILEKLRSKGFIKSFKNSSTSYAPRFEVVLSKENCRVADEEDLLSKFQLTATLMTTSNMHLLDKSGEIRQFHTAEDILMEFCKLRLDYYIKRMNRDRKILEDLKSSRNKKVIEQRLHEHEDILAADGLGYCYEIVEDLSVDDPVSVVKDSLIPVNMEKQPNQFESLYEKTAKSLWLNDLNELEKALNEIDRQASETSALETTSSIPSVAMERELEDAEDRI